MRWAWLVLACCAMEKNQAQNDRRIGKLREVFAWTQLSYNIEGTTVLTDRIREDSSEDLPTDPLLEKLVFAGDPESNGARSARQADNVVFNEQSSPRTWSENVPDSRKFFIQANNVPMGAERWGKKLFVAVPRRRYGIPATLNYLDLDTDKNVRSPGLRPYPNLAASRSLTSVYRTRADRCNRLWMVDTGLLEIPDDNQQVQPPAIVVFDLNTDQQLFRYPFKASDLVSAITPTGLASITVDLVNGDCKNAYAYVPDLSTNGIIVYSLRDNDSWRFSHNSFSHQPTAGNLNVGGQSFSWNDGIFSLTLSPPSGQFGDRIAYYHALISNQEFAVSNKVLQNKTLAARSYHGNDFHLVGERGSKSQCTMHDYHGSSGAIFFAEINNNAVSCWNTGRALSPDNVVMLAQDSRRLIYPSDLHVTGDELWVIANSLPVWIYSSLNPDQYNFFIYRASIRDLIAGTACDMMSLSDQSQESQGNHNAGIYGR